MQSRTLLTTLSALLLLVFASCPDVFAQQFQGSTYTQSLPPVNGAELTFWNIRDAKNANTSLLNYQNLGEDGKRQKTTTVQKVVIMIHGLNQDPGTYMASMLSALAQTKPYNSVVSRDTISIVAPSFSNGDQKNSAYPWTTGLSVGAGSTSQALVWQGAQWASGANNQYPYKQTTVSSYAVLDQMLQYYSDNAALYPNLKSIVVAGHSLGGQCVNRYAAIGVALNLRVPVRYWQGNPNSYVFFGTDRPVYRDPASVCSTYGNWREGTLGSLPAGYNTALTSQGSAAILANFRSKSLIYAKGTLDKGDDSSSCAPSTTGENRDDRFYAQLAAFPPDSMDNVDYSVIGHDAPSMMAAPAGRQRLFLDNLSGDGSQAPDFGDRQQIGDSPNPSSSNAPPPAIVGTGAAGATYYGCVVDATITSAHSLSNIVSVSGSLTVESCTAACSSAGFSITGLLGGNQCLCGNTLAYDALKVVDRACSTACPGNSAEWCGSTDRLSIWSGGTPAQNAAYGNVDTIPGYKYAGCYVDNANNVRALSGKASASNSMTIETCAASCSGFQYFGTEYGTECYCSQTLTAALVAQSNCTMTCGGSATQLCGAGNRLSVYNSTTLISSSTTTSSTTSATATTTTSSSSNATTSSGTSTSSSAPAASDAAYKGCYVDGASRSLPTQAYANSSNTPARCRAACSALGLPIAGTEYGTECWCGSQLASSATVAASGDCNMPCAGDASQICGAGNRLSVYSDLATLPVAATPQIPQSVGGYTFSGCYSDSGNPRTLPNGAAGGSVETCAASCSGSQYYGLEYGGECWCGSSIASSASLQPTADCGMTCTGNNTELCGGPNRIAIYAISASSSMTSSAASSTTSSSTTSSSSASSTLTSSTETTTSSTSSSSTTTSSATSSSSAPSAGASGYRGCWTDGGTRTLSTQAYADSNNSPARCRSACTALGLPIAGMEYGSECWCGSQLASGATTVADSQCSMACSGDSTQKCGAGNRLSLYSDLETLPVAPVALIVQTSGSYTFTGCYSDSVNSRSLPNSVAGGSVERCATSCAGSAFFGVEYASECYCGPSLASTAVLQPTSDCSMTCSRDPTELCGGSNRLAVYSLSSGSGSGTTTSSSATATSSTQSTTSSTTSSTDTSAATTTSSSTSTSATTTTSTSTSTSTSSTTSSSSSSAPSTSSTAYKGCLTDSTPRTLARQAYARTNNTIPLCRAACTSLGFPIAGLEYGTECWCASYLTGTPKVVADSQCNMACPGDSTQNCGAGNRLSVYSDLETLPVAKIPQTSGSYTYAGCYTDNANPRTLSRGATGGSVEKCAASCSGSQYFGVEYGAECYCGSTIASSATVQPDTDCNMSCSDDGSQLCGGPSRLAVYSLNAST